MTGLREARRVLKRDVESAIDGAQSRPRLKRTSGVRRIACIAFDGAAYAEGLPFKVEIEPGRFLLRGFPSRVGEWRRRLGPEWADAVERSNLVFVATESVVTEEPFASDPDVECAALSRVLRDVDRLLLALLPERALSFDRGTRLGGTVRGVRSAWSVVSTVRPYSYASRRRVPGISENALARTRAAASTLRAVYATDAFVPLKTGFAAMVGALSSTGFSRGLSLFRALRALVPYEVAPDTKQLARVLQTSRREPTDAVRTLERFLHAAEGPGEAALPDVDEHRHDARTMTPVDDPIASLESYACDLYALALTSVEAASVFSSDEAARAFWRTPQAERPQMWRSPM